MTFDWDEKPELNITPFVDVMLVLLSILMISIPSIIYEEHILLPSGSANNMQKKISIVELRIDKKKNVYFKNDKWSFKHFPDNFLLKTKTYNKKSSVQLRADKRLLYDDVMSVLRVIKNAGFVKVSLITDG
ncbi:Biopolymer transport protein ExbD/TolR [hydrothermal vent metagenome]|uniref:Biopolymer transport protein ExbD/TolR n=1 Tax=hydrothermal vent metagenome TaxID=652676 RepID=A0A3B1E7Q5_9ZZZZ